MTHHTELLSSVYQLTDAMGVCMTLLVGTERALLVDTGYGVEDLAASVASLTDRPLDVVLTHGHHDHALGARWFPHVFLHPAEAAVYGVYTGEAWRRRVLDSALQKGLNPPADFLTCPMPAPALLEGGVLPLGGMRAEVVPCPGHTPGSLAVYVPERQLLITGDDWNPTTWLFFPEALDVFSFRRNLRKLLQLPFANVLCAHREGLFPRAALEQFAAGLTDERILAAPPCPVGEGYDIRTSRLVPCEGQELIFRALI